MNFHQSIVRLAVWSLLIGGAFVTVISQTKGDDWLRVVTGEDESIDVDRTSLRFTPGSLGYSAVFRTTLIVPAEVPSRRGAMYLTRLDTIEFGQGHRVIASRFLDAKSVEVHSAEYGANAKWLVSWGRSSGSIYSAASQLSPFGNWRIAEYRYATGEKGSPQDEESLKTLVGSSVRFKPRSLNVGDDNCNISVYEGKTISNADAKAYFDTTLATLGLEGDNLNAVRFKCEDPNKRSYQSFLLRVSHERAIMLWSGVFLELRRVPTEFAP